MNTSGLQAAVVLPTLADLSLLPLLCAFGAEEASDSIGGGGQKKNSNTYLSTVSGEVHVNDNSTLTLYPTGQEFSGSVRLCLVDDVITVFTRLDADPAWTERNSFTHAIGTTLGAGVMINDFQAGTAEVEGQFEYVRFRDIDSVDDCR